MKKLFSASTALILLLSCLSSSAKPVLISTTSAANKARITINNKATCPESTMSKCVIRTFIDDETGDVTGTVSEELISPTPTDTPIENPGLDAAAFHDMMVNTLENGGELPIAQ